MLSDEMSEMWYSDGKRMIKKRRIDKMLSKIPIDLEKIDGKNIDTEVLRVGIIAELDAINLYEQMAAMAQDKNIKAMLLDIAKEEKTHMGEFQALLLKRDLQQVEELEKGKEEVKKEVGE
jgi:rubrerythrin